MGKQWRTYIVSYSSKLPLSISWATGFFHGTYIVCSSSELLLSISWATGIFFAVFAEALLRGLGLLGGEGGGFFLREGMIKQA